MKNRIFGFISKNLSNKGASLPIVLGLIGISSAIYLASDMTMTRLIKAQKILLLEQTFHDIQGRTNSLCGSLFNLRESNERFASQYTNNSNSPFISSEIGDCLNKSGTCNQKLADLNEPVEIHSGYAMNLLSHDGSARLVGNSQCPAFFTRYGAPLSTGSNLNNCNGGNQTGFKVFGSLHTKCKNGTATCDVASEIIAKCTVQKVSENIVLNTESEYFNLSGFVCSGNEAVSGFSADGQFLCREMIAVVGPKGDTGDSKVGGPGSQGPPGDLFTTVRGNGHAGCFLQGTLIKVKDGEKPIEQITQDDWIYNPKLDKFQRAIKKTVGPEMKPLYEIVTKVHKLTVTFDHPILVFPDLLVDASQVKVGDIIYTRSGQEAVKQINVKTYDNPPIVYNISIQGSEDTNEHLIEANGIYAGDLFLQTKSSLKQKVSEK